MTATSVPSVVFATRSERRHGLPESFLVIEDRGEGQCVLDTGRINAEGEVEVNVWTAALGPQGDLEFWPRTSGLTFSGRRRRRQSSWRPGAFGRRSGWSGRTYAAFFSPRWLSFRCRPFGQTLQVILQLGGLLRGEPDPQDFACMGQPLKNSPVLYEAKDNFRSFLPRKLCGSGTNTVKRNDELLKVSEQGYNILVLVTDKVCHRERWSL